MISAHRPSAALVAAVLAAAVAPRPAAAEPTRLTLEQLTARALTGPRARMAAADTDGARARTREVTSALFPRVSVSGFVGPSPEIRCLDASCDASDPDGFAWKVGGVWTGVTLDVVQPVYAYGKAGPARAATRAGVRAQQALEDESAGDVAVEAARAYWGLKLARELRYMLEDGIEQLGRARERLAERLADGDTEVTIEDQQRLDVIVAEARIQLEDAAQGEDIALAAVRVLAGDDDADIDEEPIEAISYQLADSDGYLARAQRRVAAATDGENAARAWVAAVVQADAIGTAASKDLADAYLAWFQMRARLASAIMQWNVATVRLDRAVGGIRAAR
jgi:outer membrane protein TolC